MPSFEKQYQQLNLAQRLAVDTIEGPMLVLAGPGTGKTQLLSVRVANIIRQTDTNPANILCLTFTDNAARNMRERLQSIIGQAAYHVSVHTFHSFGVEIINQYPDYFQHRQLLRQVDELGIYELLKSIFDTLPHSNPLSPKINDEYVMLADTLNVISWLKQNGLRPAELHYIINENQKFISRISEDLSSTFNNTPSIKYLALYNRLLSKIGNLATGERLFGFPEYASECANLLEEAISKIDHGRQSAPSITEWRNKWCIKNARGQHVFKDGGRNARKMHTVANIYQQLLDLMSRQGLYDFDDMVTQTVHSLEANKELKYNLQERFQYILVDEFQDTNKAQFRILQALGDNKLFEGRPNIMAVGDDDQAIYSFQGAEVSNMVAFTNLYRRPTLITLTDNYRSSNEVLVSSSKIAGQITDRLSKTLPGLHKKLVPKITYNHHKISHKSFVSELAQYSWISEHIKDLIKQDVPPSEIAVIAPRHRYLERLMPYLGSMQVPVAYERRENILEAPIIKQLIAMSRLIVCLSENQQKEADSLFSEILGYDFWQIRPEVLVKISLDCYELQKHWLEVLTQHKNKTVGQIARWFDMLARHSHTEPLEYVLDQLLGEALSANDTTQKAVPPAKQDFKSPMRDFYFNKQLYQQSTDSYLVLLGQLTTLRQRLREWKPDKTLYIRDLAIFVGLHERAHIKIIDTNPHTQTTQAVQVMTAYKAKGLEFTHVFIVNAQDEVWGPTSRQRSAKISLPKNLPIAPASDGDNDKLRLLFVAMSRAKNNLTLTSYSHDLDNRLSPPLSFIVNDKLLKPIATSGPVSAKASEILSTDWMYRFKQVIASEHALLEPILTQYKFNSTHLNNFIDVTQGGPEYFLQHNLLRFPAALSPSAAYGDCIHKILQWLHIQVRLNGKLPDSEGVKNQFSMLLSLYHLKQIDYKTLEARGRQAIIKFIKLRPTEITADAKVERSFAGEGVVINGARLSGKIDKLSLGKDGQISIVDYKTGKPAISWTGRDEFEKIKLHKYRQQLLFYKLLVENSASFSKRFQVNKAGLVFVEADDNGKLVDDLLIDFDKAELKRFTILIDSIWQHIMSLNFPDTSAYKRNLSGMLRFEADLIGDHI